MTNIRQSVFPFKERDILSLLDKMTFSYSHPANSHLVRGSSARELMEANKTSSYLPSFDVDSIRQDFPILQRTVHDKPLIWFDNAATTQKPQKVIDAISHFYQYENSNIHRGAHTLSMEATDKYEKTRKKTADFIHAGSEKEIIFVRGATEGINLVANTFGKKYIGKGDEIIIGLFEHHSNILPWQILCEEKEAVLRVIPLHENGELMMDEYAKLLNSKTKLVAIAHVSNALGTVVPVHRITQMAHQYGAFVLVDGAQGVPHFEVDVRSIDCDFYIFSAHKLFGPTGIGIVYGKEAILQELPPWQVGGGMIEKVTMRETQYAKSPYKFEAGTGSIAEVFGLDAALNYLESVGMTRIASYEKELMSYTLSKLNAISRLKILGNPQHRVGSIPFIIEGIDTNKIGTYLDQYGIAIRTGHHCAQPVLAFYGVESTARASLAFYNTQKEVDMFVLVLEEFVNKRTNTLSH